jgi:C-terminal processing protease CtpA/Prc
VTSESPAAKLGLVPGDEILSIDGKPTAGIQLPALRESFKAAVGTSFQLRVKTPTGEKDLTLVLADQV